MRIGIFGGTFDPVHLGHLILAEQAREQAELDEVWFVPAPRPPQKDSQSITRFEQRVEMLAIALAGNPAFRINEIEKDRSGPSYTIDTLTALKCLHPEHSLHLLLGSDSLVDLPTWREPRGIVALASLVVMVRPSSAMPSAEELNQRLGGDARVSLQGVDAPLIDIASRDLRRRVREGRSIRYVTPRGVEIYVLDKKLYREEVE